MNADNHDKTRILIVDDDPSVNMLLRAQLSHLGYAVSQANTAEEALHMLEAERNISLVLSDINLPGILDGHGLLHAIQGTGIHTQVILMSGLDLEMDKGMPFLRKPFTLNDVATLINNTMGKTQL